MPAYDDAETAAGHDPIRSLSWARGHAIAVFMSIAAGDILRFECRARDVLLE
jgi:hypothetical protein